MAECQRAYPGDAYDNIAGHLGDPLLLRQVITSVLRLWRCQYLRSTDLLSNPLQVFGSVLAGSKRTDFGKNLAPLLRRESQILPHRRVNHARQIPNIDRRSRVGNRRGDIREFHQRGTRT